MPERDPLQLRVVAGDRVLIGEVVIDVARGRATLHIDAPAEMRIRRQPGGARTDQAPPATDSEGTQGA